MHRRTRERHRFARDLLPRLGSVITGPLERLVYKKTGCNLRTSSRRTFSVT